MANTPWMKVCDVDAYIRVTEEYLKGGISYDAWKSRSTAIFHKKSIDCAPTAPAYDPVIRANNPEYTRLPNHVTTFPPLYPECGEED